MAQAERTSSDGETVKVVVLGTPGAGKAGIVKAVADAYAHSSVRVGELGGARVYRTEFYWPEALPDGRQLRVRLFAVSGAPSYGAVTELLLQEADGLLFAASLAHETGVATRDALRAMVAAAGHLELDLGTLPSAMQYVYPPGAQTGTPQQMDEWLGIPSGSLPTFLSGREGDPDPGSGVNWVIEELMRRRNPAEEKRRAS